MLLLKQHSKFNSFDFKRLMNESAEVISLLQLFMSLPGYIKNGIDTMSLHRFFLAFVIALSGIALIGGNTLVSADDSAKAGTNHTEENHDKDHGDHQTGPPLKWKRDLALWSAVSFILFVFVLRATAWNPIISGLEKRESGIQQNIADAHDARIKAEKMLADHEEKLSAVQAEVREILDEARRDADHAKQEILAQAQADAEAAKKRSISEIERARDAALKDLFDVMTTQVAGATERVLNRSITGDDQDRLIEEALSQFSEQSS